MPKFVSCPHVMGTQAYENVCKCPHINIKEKNRYLKAMSRCRDDDDAVSEHNAITRIDKRRGPAPKRLMPTEGLGVLISESAFITKVSIQFKISPIKFKSKLKAWLIYHEKRERNVDPTETERLAADSFHRAKVPSRADGQIWLFRNPDRSDDAFEGVLDRWLPHRLGLKVWPGQKRLTFGFWASRVDDCREPTFFDPDWYYLPLWDWRGKTRALATTPPSHPGLEETVAVPPLLNALNRAVVRITVS